MEANWPLPPPANSQSHSSEPVDEHKQRMKRDWNQHLLDNLLRLLRRSRLPVLISSLQDAAEQLRLHGSVGASTTKQRSSFYDCVSVQQTSRDKFPFKGLDCQLQPITVRHLMQITRQRKQIKRQPLCGRSVKWRRGETVLTVRGVSHI